MIHALPIAAVIVAAALFLPTPAGAQQTAPSIVSADVRRWDVAAHIGWLGTDKSEIAVEWDEWAHAVAGGVSAGRYFTPHVKAEFYGVVSGEGLVYGEIPVQAPGGFPIAPIPREHYFRQAAIGIGLSYQWFDNQWFHPFVGAGAAVVREHERVVARQPVVPPRDPRALLVIPSVTTTSQVSYGGRPFLMGGFKWYPTERAFFRADLRALMSAHGLAELVWTAAIGADL